MRLLNDIRLYPQLDSKKRLYLVAFLTALSGFLSVIDAMIPKPLPFVKLGLANLITLIIIMEGRNWLAIQVAFFRTLVASLILGTFLSYTYLLSASGAIGSALLSIAAFQVLAKRISAIGLSVWGALWSVAFQGLIVGLFFGFDKGLLMLLSVFLLIGIAGGLLIGILANAFLKSEKPELSEN